MPNLKLPSYDELTHDDWAALSEAVLQFEALWQQTSAPSLRPFLKSEGDPLRLRLLIELVRVDQEHRWERGDRKQVEDYLQDWPELGATPRALAELLQTECLTRFCLDDAPSSAEVSQRFPQLADQVDLDQLRAQASDERRPGSTEQNEATATYHRSPQVAGSLRDRNASRGATRLRIGQMTGRRFGRYEIRRLIATGGMGVVYEARDTELNRVVALKIPRADMLHDRTAMQRFVNEARAAAVIRHPHVCPIFDVGEIDGQNFLTMPLVEGVSLSAWLEQQTVTPRDAAELILKLASAVQAVHDAGIRHRDIKASNVMIDQRGEPLLMDFGLARVPQTGEQLTHSGSLIGTPAYMAPEQIHEGATGGDERSDVYSLGVLLFQLLTGRLPFEGPITRVLVEIATREPPTVQSLRPDVDADLAALCHKAMSRRPAERFQTAKEFEGALETWLQSSRHVPRDEPSTSDVERLPAQTTSNVIPEKAPHAEREGYVEPPNRRRTLTALAAAAFVLLAGLVIRVATDKAELVIVAPEKGVEVSVRHVSGTEQPLTLTTGENNVRVRSGTVEVVLTGAQADQYEVGPDRIVFTRGDRKVVEITRRQLVASREGTAREGEAPAEPSTRSSSWDQLDPKHIPPSERVPRQPEGLVAVLGEQHHRAWGYFHQPAVSADGSQFAMSVSDRFTTALYFWNRGDLVRPIILSPKMISGYPMLSDARLRDWQNADQGDGPEGYFHFGVVLKWAGAKAWFARLCAEDGAWWGTVTSAMASADGRWLSHFSKVGGIDLWDMSPAEPQRIAKYPMPKTKHQFPDRSFSQDSRWFCYVDRSDLTIRIVDLQKSPPSEVAKLQAADSAPDGEPENGYVAAAFLHDGRLATCDGNSRIWLWNISQTPTRLPKSFGKDNQERSLLAAAQAPVLIARTNQSSGFFVWDLSASEPTLRCTWSPDASSLSGDALSENRAAVSPDGRILMTGHANYAIRFWDISGAKPVEQMSLRPNPTIMSSGTGDGHSFGPFVVDDLVLTTNELHKASLWQIEGDRLVSHPAPSDGDHPVEYLLSRSADGRVLAAKRYVDANERVVLFSRVGHRFEPIAHITSEVFQDAALNHDGSRLAIGIGPKLELWAIEGAGGRKLAEITTNRSEFNQIEFLDDNRLVTRSSSPMRNFLVQLWDVQPPEIKLRVELPENNIKQFALSPNRETLAVGGAGRIQCWDLRSFPPQVTPPFADRLYENGPGAVALSPDGRTLAAATWRVPPDDESPLSEKGDAKADRSLRDRNADGSGNAPATLEATFGHGIELIDVATGETKRRLAYPGPVRNIQFTPDGQHLVTANGNSTIYVVRLARP